LSNMYNLLVDVTMYIIINFCTFTLYSLVFFYRSSLKKKVLSLNK